MRKTITKTITYYVCNILTTQGEMSMITLTGDYDKARKEIINDLNSDNFMIIDIQEITRTFSMPIKMFIDVCIKRGDLGGLNKNV